MSVAGTITTEAEQSSETLARWTWCGVIFSFLGLQILLSSVAIFLSTSDPSNVIVEGYYEQALSWDQQRQTQAQSDALGWNSVVTLENSTELLSKPKLELSLLNQAGLPIKNSKVEGELFHHARAGDVFKIHFTETRPGHYAALVPIKQQGLWELSIAASGAAGTFQETKQFQFKTSGEFKHLPTKH
ncbi:FixH family protein [uncultured Gimesia sp.]|uniref:FixH family protein n=1 Tax=uncultured Gimesia sp. TaxID=1678688 RepID=UPI0030D6DAD0|tara:strand:- start:49654 stop:50214 length:561 start_codon:yes stop_codon:yes gene_type:complete